MRESDSKLELLGSNSKPRTSRSLKDLKLIVVSLKVYIQIYMKWRPVIYKNKTVTVIILIVKSSENSYAYFPIYIITCCN